MFKPLYETVRNEASGLVAFRHVEAIAQHHRLQASPGYREAARYCASYLKQQGIRAEILAYPADGLSTFWGTLMPREWAVEEAELWVVEPEHARERLASYEELKLSIAQRSHGTPEGGVEAELVIVEDGEDPRSYEGLDVKGKILFARGNPWRLREIAVDRLGAVGVITDQLREVPPARRSMDIPDARQYHTLGWTGSEPPAFGFVLSPRLGEKLRALAARVKKETGGASGVKLWARVRARFYSGSVEVVSATLPGRSAEEVVGVAHLCHPQWSANDNASGCAALLETARSLNRLIRAGKLARPRRRIRFLLVPEMTGTLAYLATRPGAAAGIVAGLNLDMVGENQELCQSVLLVEKPPRSLPSFAGDLLEMIVRQTAAEARNPGATAAFPLFRQAVTAFSGGSDHYIFSDPTVGVPMPMIIHWPDVFYHTSLDTPDKVDANMLARVSAFAATYLYFLASGGAREARWLAHEIASSLPEELRAATTSALADATAPPRQDQKQPADRAARSLAFLKRRHAFLLERKMLDMRSAARLIRGKREVASFHALCDRLSKDMALQADIEARRAASLFREVGWAAVPTDGPPPASVNSEWEIEAKGLVLRRLFPGPVQLRPHAHRLSSSQKDTLWSLERQHEGAAHVVPVQLLYWADGQRTLAQIAEAIELETGVRDMELLVKYARILADLGLVELGGASSGATPLSESASPPRTCNP